MKSLAQSLPVWLSTLAAISSASPSATSPVSNLATRARQCQPAYSATTTYVGCYHDPNSPRDLSGPFLTVGNTNSPSHCADLCGAAGYSFSGVEFAIQCFCGNEIESTAIKASESDCNTPCPADPSKICGGGNMINIYSISNPEPNPRLPSFPDCTRDPLCSNDVCDTSLSIQDRAAALVNALTLDEKVSNVGSAATGSSRLALPAYPWQNEALHGVAGSTGVQFQSPLGANFSAATSFPMPILMSAAFDDDLINSVATAIGTEARAFGNAGFAGLDFWTPNINPYRDPRWGRGMETPGEDVYHIQRYVYSLVTGLQGGVNPEFNRIIATCKHFAAYDVENSRLSEDVNPTAQDLADFYFPPFKTCVRDAKVTSVMCSYNAVDGIPACASEYLLQNVLREHWGFTEPYNYVVSDCDAVENVFDEHHYVSDFPSAAAVSLNAGTDLDCGSTYNFLNVSVLSNLTTEATLDKSLTRLYAALIQLGYFDYTNTPYSGLSWADVNTTQTQSLAYKAAVEGFTLLKNDGTLPLPKQLSSVAVIGPWANATTQMQGNYAGTAPFLISPLSAFQSHFSNVHYAPGADINSQSTSNFAAAISAAQASDYIIYLGGIDITVENEGFDRSSIAWPGNQLDLISQLSNLGKPLVVVQFGGGQIDDSALLSNKGVNSILWAGYPGQDGGNAVVDALTGTASVAGRLPITQYPASYVNGLIIQNMNLRPSSGYPGRTYKWYNGTPVLPFGYGLHYTNFSFTWQTPSTTSYSISSLVNNAANPKDQATFATFTVSVKNTGGRANLASDYVGLLFLSTTNAGPAPHPNKQLVAYGRLHNIGVGATQQLTLTVNLEALMQADTNGDRSIYPGDYTLAFDIDNKLTFHFTLTGSATLIDSQPRNLANVVAYEDLGCYQDTTNSAGSTTVLSGPTIQVGQSNYPQQCVNDCAAQGFHFAGVKQT
ncbi:glycoside hydrolase superfamily [Xylogone sp. PMI_703]|nr:glycoside hydrolase superfamily [Xylogone sp. PMI_703]